MVIVELPLQLCATPPCIYLMWRYVSALDKF